MAPSSTTQLTTLVLWAIAWAAAMIASAILLKGNPIKDWVQAALFIGAMSFWCGSCNVRLENNGTAKTGAQR